MYTATKAWSTIQAKRNRKMIIEMFLESVTQQLVHLGDLGRDAEIDGLITHFDDQAA